MLIEIKVPALAESVSDATLLAWQKQEGDAVSRGENLIDLETDKVTLEVAAPENGVLQEIVSQEGATVVTGDILAIIDTDGEVPADPDEEISATTLETSKETPVQQASKLNPAARKLATEKHIDPDQLIGRGPDGRITKADVIVDKPQTSDTTSETHVSISAHRDDKRMPMTRLRKRAAERLLSAQQNNAILTTFNEVNMQAVMDLRSRHKEKFEKEYGVRLGFLSFFAKAIIEGLHRFPVINASVDGEDIIYHNYFDIGIAVSSKRGLVVPVIRDADQLSFAEFEQTVGALGEKARSGGLTIEDLTGGTFTITNGGTFGSLLSTPIINPPQSAILGMHNIQERPVAENDQVVIRPMMYIALSYDHRIIDGSDAVRFLVTVKEMLEDPARILLEI